MTWDSGICFNEILKFIKHKCEMVLLTIAQQLLKELGKCFHLAVNFQPKHPTSRFLKFACQYLLVVFGNV